MNSGRVIVNEVLLSKIEALHAAASKITVLQICALLADGPMTFENLSQAILPNPQKLVHGKSAAYQRIVQACLDGFIRNDVEGWNDEHAYELTDAGRYVVMTSVTGPTAHDVLAEIEAEMAGEA